MVWLAFALGRMPARARAGVRILMLAFAGAVLGKLMGIAVHRLRTRRLRDTGSAITQFTHSELSRPRIVASSPACCAG